MECFYNTVLLLLLKDLNPSSTPGLLTPGYNEKKQAGNV